MVSTLTWIDYDSVAHEKSLQMIRSFHEPESRDELGLGAIRDSFSDRLFPGTSTLHTRLRYMLFVAWTYKECEHQQYQSRIFGARAEDIERNLIQPLISSVDPDGGVFGNEAGSELKRLPSSAYWGSLGSWGIRTINASQRQYEREIDRIYERNRKAKLQADDRDSGDSDQQHHLESGTRTWHSGLPEPPQGFPEELENLDFSLTVNEAEFILDRLQTSHPYSLLYALACGGALQPVAEPWLLDSPQITEDQRGLLNDGRQFSTVMHGAALLYNHLLASQRKSEEWTGLYEGKLQDWNKSLDLNEIGKWSLDEFWEPHQKDGLHRITSATKEFVREWVDTTLELNGRVISSNKAGSLIRKRERIVKKNRSRFDNEALLRQWNGSSATGIMTYRWERAQQFLKDLHRGLGVSTS